jgi:hypothetical protein
MRGSAAADGARVVPMVEVIRTKQVDTRIV